MSDHEENPPQGEVDETEEEAAARAAACEEAASVTAQRAAEEAAKAAEESELAKKLAEGLKGAKGSGKKPVGKYDPTKPRQIFPYEDLKGRAEECANMPVDPSSREEHLSDEEFKKYFKMSKDEFRGLPKWKKEGLKKGVNLF